MPLAKAGYISWWAQNRNPPMIESVMFFALGLFTSGLVALAILRALVRRTRRVTEKNLRASLSTRRSEFQAERDELKARHAVIVRQLEREGGALRDQATAHRLEADMTDRENVDLRADLNARETEVDELTERLESVQGSLLQVERKLAESGTALRTAHHALESEAGRRADLHDRLAEMNRLAEQRRLEIVGLRAEMARLRSRMGFAAVSGLAEDAGAGTGQLFAGIDILRPSGPAAPPADPPAGALIPAGGPVPPILDRTANVINLPVETPLETPEAENIRKIASEINRIAGEAAADLERGVWRALAHPPAANASPNEVDGEAGDGAAAVGPDGPPQAGNDDGEYPPKQAEALAMAGNVEALRRVQSVKTAEARFMRALEDIRALKRAAGPAGE